MKTHVHDETTALLLRQAVDFYLDQQSFPRGDEDIPKLEELVRQLCRAHEVVIVTDEDN